MMRSTWNAPLDVATSLNPLSWPVWRRLAFALAAVVVVVPTLPWLFLLAGSPLDPTLAWDPSLRLGRLLLWLALPALALLAVLGLRWPMKLSAVSLALALAPILHVIGFFGQTYAIGNSLASQTVDDPIPRVQIVQCHIFIFHWYRVQQARRFPLVERSVTTYFLGDDDACPPTDFRFEVRDEGRSMVMTGEPCHYMKDDSGPARHDLARFEIGADGRLY